MRTNKAHGIMGVISLMSGMGITITSFMSFITYNEIERKIRESERTPIVEEYGSRKDNRNDILLGYAYASAYLGPLLIRKGFRELNKEE